MDEGSGTLTRVRDGRLFLMGEIADGSDSVYSLEMVTAVSAMPDGG